MLAACFVTVACGEGEGARPLILQTLSNRDGLPQGTVMATLQDSQGFVWLGTEDGLVRFDGHELHRYAYSPDRSDGLPGNFINAIVEDTRGDLWIGIKGSGLARWHRASDSFTTYRHDASKPDSLASDAVRTLLVGSRGELWIGTLDAGLDVLDPASGRFRHFRHEADRDGTLLSDQVQSVVQDQHGHIWIGTDAGLNRWQPDRGAFLAIGRSAETGVSLAGQHISQIMNDRAGSLWIATFDAGLFQMDPSDNVIAAYRHDPAIATSLISNDVRALLDDQAGHIWVGTAEGLELLDRKSGEFTHYIHDRSDPDSLEDSFIMSLYRDPTGLVWIGMRSGGVSRWNPRSWELGSHRPHWAEGKLITSFADAPGSQIWVGSLGGGLVLFDPQSGDSRTIDEIAGRRNALGEQRVMSLLQDRAGSLWIGTMASGVKKFAQGRIQSIPVKPGDAHSLSASGIMTLFESRDGRIWVGTHGGGANIIEPQSGRIRQLPLGTQLAGGISAGNVTSFAEDATGNIWIGTDGGGVNIARPDGTVVAVFRHDPKDPSSLSANTVYSLTVDQAGTVWIATDGAGINQVLGSASQPDAIRFRNFSHSNGLSSDTIYGVLADATGSLWMSGNSGLMRMNTASRTFKTYHREQGLQGEEFNFGAFFRSSDGLLCFGGPGGFNIFDPAHLSDWDTPPRLALMYLEVLGAPMRSAKPYWLLDQVELDHRDNIVSFDFAALDFASPGRNQLAYRMAGLTDRWINLGSQRRVTLTNLPAGNHLLEVRAFNSDRVASQPLRLSIHKRAAPWRSSTAYASYALATLGLLVLLVRGQRRRLTRALAAQQRLESQVETRTHELSESNRQLAAASEAKSHFLARMSHELRTPMNGIVGMAELLARGRLSAAQARQTQTIRTSAQTLLQILNDLLDLSKAQAGKVRLEILPLELTQIMEECAALFAGAADAKGLDLIVCPPLERCMLLGDPLRLRQVLMNLIGNAIKFTERGEVVISCDLRHSPTAPVDIELTVKDTGIGLTEEAIARVFEPFTQADETMTRRFGGTGLGLSICRELLDLMGGSIAVQSTPGVGSSFRVLVSLERTPSTATGGALRDTKALILTPHLTLSDALHRYCSQLGMQCTRSELAAARSPSADIDVILFDGDRYPDELLGYARSTAPPVVIIASASLAEREPLRALTESIHLLRKPITAQALEEACLRARSATSSAISKPAPAELVRGSRGKVLIVEDDHINAAVAEGYLTELGCSSDWVETGAAAVGRCAVERFDMILMDLNMPGLDGYATAALIRKNERTSQIPIVALTANDAAAYREACLRAGMDDILSKPYTFEAFEKILDRWVPALAPTASLPAEQASSEGMAIIDTGVIASLRRIRPAGREDLPARLAGLFAESAARDLQQIEELLTMRSLADAASLCHKLKSAAANIGALNFSRATAELEQICRKDDLAAASALFASLKGAFPTLVAGLSNLQVRDTA